MKLYDLKKGSKIYETIGSSVGKVYNDTPDTDPVIFDHLDGVYSYCYLQSDPKIVVHLSASCPMVEYKDGYKIAPHTEADHEEANHATANRA